MCNKKPANLRICLLCVLLFVSSFCFSAPIEFTEEEKAFIADHPTIRLGIDKEFVPFEFIDSEGKFSGISSDIVKLISESTGLSFTYEADLDWVNTIEKAKKHDLDVLSALGETEERKQYLIYLAPYMGFQQSIIIKNTNTTIAQLEDLFYRQVAVQKNTFWEGFLKDYPQIQTRAYSSVEEALLSVYRGEEIAYLGNDASSKYWSRKLGLTDLSFIPLEQVTEQNLSFAVRNDWPLLASIIEKGLLSISDKQYNAIFNTWILTNTKKAYALAIRILVLGVFLVLLVVLISVFWIRKLKREISYKDLMQKELETEKQKVELANKEKSLLMARMSHEIRTPLNGINGTTYLLEKSELTVAQRRYLSIISGATKTMLSLINDILDYSRINEHCLTLEYNHFHLDELIQEIIMLENWALEKKELKVSILYDKNVPVVLKGDSGKLAQILSNLIHNAIKFTLQGTITIQVSHVRTVGERCTLSIQIQDTGIGMSKVQVNEIFQPFMQADESISRRFGGSGLGLSIVKGLVSFLEGSITVESKEAVGSTFTVTLPFLLDTGETENCADSQLFSKFTCQRALLVFKNKSLVPLVGNLLDTYHIEYDFVESEHLALSLLETEVFTKENSYRLLIMDAPNWTARPLRLLSRLSKNDKIDTDLKILLLLEDDSDYDRVKTDDFPLDFVLSLPLNRSVFFNALLEMFVPGEKIPSPISESDRVLFNDIHNRILVIEDNKINQIISKEILQNCGFSVTLASNGQEGVDFYSKNEEDIDLIILDLHMDVMDGYEALKRIRVMNPVVPIIITSADLYEEARAQALALGASEFLGKPYDPDTLITIASELILKNRVFTEGPKYIDFDLGLLRVGEDKVLYNLVLLSFVDEFTGELALFQKAIGEKNYFQASEIVHKIKGGCGTIGATVAQTLASQLQTMLNEGYSAKLSEKVSELENELKGVLFEAPKWKELYEINHQSNQEGNKWN
jgi:signal transduction histidine kinase/CheY-like chemotaxis protein